MHRITKLVALSAASLALAFSGAAPAEAALNITTQVCPFADFSITPGPGPGQLTIAASASGCTVVTHPGTYAASFNAVVNSVGSLGCTPGLATGTGTIFSSFQNFSSGGFVVVAGETIVFEANLGAISAESVVAVGQILLPNPLPCGPGGTGSLAFTIPTPPVARSEP